MAKFERKIKCPEGVPDWILTYGDMMSLLLCFFIMLYAISVIDVPRLKQAVESLNDAFGYMGSSMSPRPRPAASSVTRVSRTGRARQNKTISGGQPIVSQPGDQVQVLSVRPQLEAVPDGTIVFVPHSDDLPTATQEQIRLVATHIASSPYRIWIEGHASSLETQSIYRQPIYLAYARATAVRDALIACGIDPKAIVLTAIGDDTNTAIGGLPGRVPIAQYAFVQVYQALNFPITPEGINADK
ncbi:MAG: OmpA/MotB family protein [Thermoguttaceae bacterium]